MNIYAFIVGIEKYDQPGWDVPGPCANAIAVANWLISIGVPGVNISMFLDPAQNYDKAVGELTVLDVHVSRCAVSTEIDTFWRTKLQHGRPANSRLLVFWSGHGCTSSTGNRIFFCRDYTEKLSNRVFNGSNFLRTLKTAEFACFSEQIFLADVCGVYSNLPITEVGEHPGQTVRHQLAYFATPEGVYAKGKGDRGVFTDTVLRVLQRSKTWPRQNAFVKSLERALAKLGATPFRVAGFHNEGELAEIVVGSIPGYIGNEHFKSAIELLSALDITGSILTRHYLRTVTDLGNPALATAQGLVGMVKQLSSLRDGDLTKRLPYGLLQFLIRLAQEEGLKQPINDWLDTHASLQANTLDELREKLVREAQYRILIILIDINEKAEIIAYKPYICSNDFKFTPGINFERRTVSNWADFERNLQALLAGFTIEGRLSNIEIHFLADPLLFDRPFHRIPLAPGKYPIGEDVVVVVRDKQRVLSSDPHLREAWTERAQKLRPMQPDQLRWLKISSQAAALPKVEGLYFAGFILPPPTKRQRASENEKRTIWRLLKLGHPYIYLSHTDPQRDDWEAIGVELNTLLGKRPILDAFPSTLLMERLAGSDFACYGTIIWDDPVSNPFTLTEGASN